MKTPNVDRNDVLRVVARDFSQDPNGMLQLLGEVTCPLIGEDRLHIAILKLANGSLASLKKHLHWQSRDVVSHAESPGYSRKNCAALDRMSNTELDDLMEEDWQQYCDWLNAK